MEERKEQGSGQSDVSIAEPAGDLLGSLPPSSAVGRYCSRLASLAELASPAEYQARTWTLTRG